MRNAMVQIFFMVFWPPGRKYVGKFSQKYRINISEAIKMLVLIRTHNTQNEKASENQSEAFWTYNSVNFLYFINPLSSGGSACSRLTPSPFATPSPRFTSARKK